MDGSNFSWLTEEYIRQLADGQSFERGMNYYTGGNIRYPLRQGMELSGECYGSQWKPYRVRVVLSNNGIREASCTCPRGGFCKHIVALLLTYVHEPDSFKVLTSLDAMLARLSREELISLIGDMVQREPSLSAVVDLAVATAGGRSPDMAALNREVKRALSLDDPFEIEMGLRNILRTAERLARKEDRAGAGAVYQTVLDALTEIYGNELLNMDDDGAIAAIACECVEGLSECLHRGDCDRNTRQAWLMSLMEAELADIEMGGIDFAGDALDAIFEHAGEQDWELLRECLCEHIPKSGEWERERLVGILVAWEERNGRHEQARRLIQEMGTAEQRAFLMVRDGEPGRAVALAKQHMRDKPGIIMRLAGALADAGAGDHAVALLTELAGSKDSHPDYLEWLANYHSRNGELDEALKWQRRLFEQYPTLKSFRELRQICEELGVWPQVRNEILKMLERKRKKQAGILIEIALEEGDVARALELVPGIPPVDWDDYRGKVARAAEEKHPREAIKLYLEMAEAAIALRQRKHYSYAAGLLCRVKNLYERLGEQADWKNYITALKNKYARFSALHEELRKAGL